MDGVAWIRFYGELNDFLPVNRRGFAQPVALAGRPAVKDRIESLGVPHPEVDLIVRNGEPVGFSAPLTDGDRVSVYPPFRSIDTTTLPKVRPIPSQMAFVLDVHLGRLAKALRLLGFDSLYRNDAPDDELARRSGEEDRILLTRDRGLLKIGCVVHGYCLRSFDPAMQLREVMDRYRLHDLIAPFTRCSACNGRLEPASKEEIVDRLEPKTILYYDEFAICRCCGRIYWRGSHHERLRRWIESLSRSDGEQEDPPE